MTATARPQALPVIPENIPSVLRERNQFLTWRYAMREGKWTKPPIDPKNGNNGDSTDPSTWGTFAEALACLQRRRVDGIGFALAAGDPFFGLDLDKCRNPETGEIDPWAVEIIHSIGTYTEPSVSGTGIRAIGRGKIPGDRKRSGQIEIYDQKRFLTITGNPLPGYDQITDCQDGLDALYTRTFPATPKAQAPRPIVTLSLSDQDIIEAAGCINGKFSALWNGETGSYPSHSEARSALVYLLAGYTKEPDQLERLFMASNLFREDKWPRERDRLIGDALRDVTWQYEPRQSAPTITSGPVAKDRDSITTSIDPPPDCADAYQRIRELEMELSGKQARIDQLAAERDAARERHSTVIQIINNPSYTPPQAVAYVRAQFEYERLAAEGKVDDDGKVTLYLPELCKPRNVIDPETNQPILIIDEQTGQPVLDRFGKPKIKTVNSMAPSTISSALKEVAELSGAFAFSKRKDPKTGKDRVTFKPLHETTRATMAAVASASVYRDRRRGPGRGKPKDQRLATTEPCETCGIEADVVIKAEAFCGDCGESLGLLPGERITTPFQFETESDSDDTPSNVDNVLEETNLKRRRDRERFHESHARHLDHDRSPFQVETTTETITETMYCSECLGLLPTSGERRAGRHARDCTNPTRSQHLAPSLFVPAGDD